MKHFLIFVCGMGMWALMMAPVLVYVTWNMKGTSVLFIIYTWATALIGGVVGAKLAKKHFDL